MRRAITLVELCFVVLLIGLVTLASWRTWGLLARKERDVDRESARAILEAHLVEQLLVDLRSSHAVRPSPGAVEIRRSVPGPGALGEDTVRWTFSADRAVRTDRAGRHEYNFAPFLTAQEPVLRFRLTEVDGEIVPPWVARP